jgi:hypothetical protein
MKICRVVLFLLLVAFMQQGCKISYSFTGASISPEMQTVSVQDFQNRAPVVFTTLSRDLSEALKDRFQSQTRLKLINGIGDADFEGEIRDYRTQPLALQADEVTARERLTVSVWVKYTNAKDPEQSFETTFSRFEDFDSDLGLSAVEADLVKKIIDQLTQDIFNRAFVNW